MSTFHTISIKFRAHEVFDGCKKIFFSHSAFCEHHHFTEFSKEFQFSFSSKRQSNLFFLVDFFVLRDWLDRSLPHHRTTGFFIAKLMAIVRERCTIAFDFPILSIHLRYLLRVVYSHGLQSMLMQLCYESYFDALTRPRNTPRQ